MKKLIALACLAMSAVLLPSSAHADLTLVFTGDVATSSLNSPSEEIEWIEDFRNLNYDLTYLRKWEAGPNGGSFEAGIPGGTFGVTPTNGGTSADLTWNLTGTGFQANYVLVVDGVGSTQGTTLVSLYEVCCNQWIVGDGTVTLDGRKQISHILWAGTPTTTVPDGGMTLSLLGFALVGLGALRRKFNA